MRGGNGKEKAKKRTEENRERGREKKVWEEKDFALNYSGLYRLSFKVSPLQFFSTTFRLPLPLFLLPSSAGSKENRNTIRYRKEQKNPFPHKTFSLRILPGRWRHRRRRGSREARPPKRSPTPSRSRIRAPMSDTIFSGSLLITGAALVPNRRRRRRRSTADSWLPMVLAFPSPIFASVTRSQIFRQSNRILIFPPSLAHTITFLRSVVVFLFFSLFCLSSLSCARMFSGQVHRVHCYMVLASSPMSQPRRRRRGRQSKTMRRAGGATTPPFLPPPALMRAAPLLRSGKRGAKDRPKTVYA